MFARGPNYFDAHREDIFGKRPSAFAHLREFEEDTESQSSSLPYCR